MLFKVQNRGSAKSTHCGVLEFSADEGMVYMPYWVRRMAPSAAPCVALGRSPLWGVHAAPGTRLACAASLLQAARREKSLSRVRRMQTVTSLGDDHRCMHPHAHAPACRGRDAGPIGGGTGSMAGAGGD